jgi:Mg2+-importing ATPase
LEGKLPAPEDPTAQMAFSGEANGLGLTSAEAARRSAEQPGGKRGRSGTREGSWRLLLSQFRSPLVILLLVAMSISISLGDRVDAAIVLGAVLLSTLMGFWQERRAANAVAALLAMIRRKATVLRDATPTDVPLEEIVEGDVVILNAGDAIPGDALLLESKDLFVDESAMTGESFPAEKHAAFPQGPAGTDRDAVAASGRVFEGTHVVSGTARALVVATGDRTEFGAIYQRLRLRAPETDFERGLRQFGELLMRVTLLLVITIFAINVLLDRPPLDAFTFALALAVGITPELLPAIVSITLASGARRMAKEQVIVRRLSSIENLGSMDVFCSDKTGTLTEGEVRLHAAVDAHGESSEEVKRYAVLNATFESGFSNPIDEALRGQRDVSIAGYAKFDEVPYDFIRKRLSVVVATEDGRHLMITKGAVANVLEACTEVAIGKGTVTIAGERTALEQRFGGWSEEGYRVLGVAIRDVTGDPVIDKTDEAGLTFLGFLLLDDPPKADAAEAIAELATLGVGFKLITGDNRFVARNLARRVGVKNLQMLTGPDLHAMSDAALVRRVGETGIFAETEPNQKERILTALRKCGHVVGYLGDGINDASALHVADVGISVEGAVDVAKDAADMVLLRRDLKVLSRGVRIGRATFANSMKYIFITTSANFGNMASMAAASLVLPFLPLLPKQILLNNFLSDLPALAIATDSVDPEQVILPRRWDRGLIKRFMIQFGLVSSLFDLLTFAMLMLLFRTGESEFQTGWFIESLVTELLIVMVIRTRRSITSSRPSRLLLALTALVCGTAIALPYTPLGAAFGLVPLPPRVLVGLAVIAASYVMVSEWTKRRFFAHAERSNLPGG